MKIMKAYHNKHSGYSVVFDEMPKMLYRKHGNNYIGEAKNKDGEVIFSSFLQRGSSGAFGGRTLLLDMEDGTVEKIANYWWDTGWWENHGEFMQIGAGTIEDLQKCYVYTAKYINKAIFEKMLTEYLKNNEFENYDDIQKWVDFQCDWWRVKVRGKELPLLVNNIGKFINPNTREWEYTSHNLWRCYTSKSGKNKSITLKLFKYSYMENGRKITVEAVMDKVLAESLQGKPEIRLKKGMFQKVKDMFPRKQGRYGGQEHE